INVMLLQRVTIAMMQAFRQRAIKGIPVADAEGREVDYSNVFAADPGALWQLPDDAEIWESGQVDLTPILESVKADVRDLAAVTKVPMFYLFPDAANGSAEGASLQREGLVFKVADRIEQTSESWERVMSLAFGFAGDRERASLVDMETLWQPPERFSLAERYDANSKATDVPWRTRMSDILQFSPQQVARMEAERVTDAFLTMPAPPAQVP
ncbi:MAG: phage portal protein, partial [Acidimicrobiales bacterium]